MGYSKDYFIYKRKILESVSISEESAMLNFPAITICNSMEIPESIDAGTIILSGLIPDIVLDSVRIAIDEFKQKSEYSRICSEYQFENNSWRVLKIILGTTILSNKWSGIEQL